MIQENLLNSAVYKEVSGVVIVGGGISLFRGAIELSKKIFDKAVRIGSPEYVGAASPIYVTAVGIVVHTANNAKVSNNLSEQSDKHSYENKGLKNENKKGKNGFASKIKEFFADFF